MNVVLSDYYSTPKQGGPVVPVVLCFLATGFVVIGTLYWVAWGAADADPSFTSYGPTVTIAWGSPKTVVEATNSDEAYQFRVSLDNLPSQLENNGTQTAKLRMCLEQSTSTLTGDAQALVPKAIYDSGFGYTITQCSEEGAKFADGIAVNTKATVYIELTTTVDHEEFAVNLYFDLCDANKENCDVEYTEPYSHYMVYVMILYGLCCICGFCYFGIGVLCWGLFGVSIIKRRKANAYESASLL